MLEKQKENLFKNLLDGSKLLVSYDFFETSTIYKLILNLKWLSKLLFSCSFIFLFLHNSLSFIRLCSQLNWTVCIPVRREMLQGKRFEIPKFGQAFRELN